MRTRSSDGRVRKRFGFGGGGGVGVGVMGSFRAGGAGSECSRSIDEYSVGSVVLKVGSLRDKEGGGGGDGIGSWKL